MILDGKIIPADRCNEKTIGVKGQVIDLWYSGKAHRHGGNIQAAANTARARGLPAIPGDIAAPLIHAFRHGVLLGLSQIPRVPRPQATPRPRPARMPARPPG